jgi:hypothetical protein
MRVLRRRQGFPLTTKVNAHHPNHKLVVELLGFSARTMRFALTIQATVVIPPKAGRIVLESAKANK